MCLKVFRMVMVENGCGQSSGGTLKLIVSEEKVDGISDFLHVDTDSQKLQADQKIFGGYGQKLSVVSLVMVL